MTVCTLTLRQSVLAVIGHCSAVTFFRNTLLIRLRLWALPAGSKKQLRHVYKQAVKKWDSDSDSDEFEDEDYAV